MEHDASSRVQLVTVQELFADATGPVRTWCTNSLHDAHCGLLALDHDPDKCEGAVYEWKSAHFSTSRNLPHGPDTLAAHPKALLCR